jgi:quinol monooxygenase YgiN
MPTVIATVKVKEGKMGNAVEVLRETVPKIRAAESGIVSYVAHTVEGSKKDKNTIIFYEKYVDNAAMQLHMANLAKSLAKLLPLLEPGMDAKVCNEII